MSLDHCYDHPDRFYARTTLPNGKEKVLNYVGKDIHDYLNLVPFEELTEWTLCNDRIEIVYTETEYRIQRSFMVQEQSHIGCVLLPDHQFKFRVIQPELLNIRYFIADLKWFLKAFRWFREFAPITGKTLKISATDLKPYYTDAAERDAMIAAVKEWGESVRDIIQTNRKAAKAAKPEGAKAEPKEKPEAKEKPAAKKKPEPKAAKAAKPQSPKPVAKKKPEAKEKPEGAKPEGAKVLQPKAPIYVIEKTDTKKPFFEGMGYETQPVATDSHFILSHPEATKHPFLVNPINTLLYQTLTDIASEKMVLVRLLIFPKFQGDSAILIETKTSPTAKQIKTFLYHSKKSKKGDFIYILIPNVVAYEKK
jgi:hypothetical protein